MKCTTTTNWENINLFWVKWLAFVLMVLDHIGAYIMPERWELRLIGRGAFILYCWFFIQGARFSKSPLVYFWRLTCCAFVSQFILVLFFEEFKRLNIIFLFMLCLIFFEADKRMQFKSWERNLYSLAVGGIGELIGIEYGLYGAMVIFSLYYESLILWLMGGILSFRFIFQPITFIFWWIEPQLRRLEQGKKWLGFYYMYPLQWLIIGLWRMFYV